MSISVSDSWAWAAGAGDCVAGLELSVVACERGVLRAGDAFFESAVSQLSGLHRTDAAFEGASRAKLVIQCDGAAWDVRVRKRVVAAGRGGSRHGSGSGLSLLSTGRSFVARF